MSNISPEFTRRKVCTVRGLNQDELGNHRHGVHARRQCPICQVELASSGEFLAHVERKHLSNLHKDIDLGFADDIDFDVYKKRSLEIIRSSNLPVDSKIIEEMLNDESNSPEDLEKAEADSLRHTYIDNGSTTTRNVMNKIITNCKLSRYTIRTLACSYVDHYASSERDLGWGCGYRNLQMLLSSLVEETVYKERLLGAWYPNEPSRSTMLSITRLQNLIEQAWAAGFDTMGSKQLDGALVNTRKWIGATEVVALLSFFKIRCKLVDFHAATGPNTTHPELFKWVLSHFESFSENDHVPALFLQHQGHSRTIAGVEEQHPGVVNLLILDPTHDSSKMAQLVEDDVSKMMYLIRVSPSTLRAPQYQIVAVVGTIESDEEYEKHKILKSVKIP